MTGIGAVVLIVLLAVAILGAPLLWAWVGIRIEERRVRRFVEAEGMRVQSARVVQASQSVQGGLVVWRPRVWAVEAQGPEGGPQELAIEVAFTDIRRIDRLPADPAGEP